MRGTTGPGLTTNIYTGKSNFRSFYYLYFDFFSKLISASKRSPKGGCEWWYYRNNNDET